MLPLAAALLLTSMIGTALAHAGSLDRSFGNSGRVLMPVGVRNHGFVEEPAWLHTPVRTAVGPEGQIIVAGERTVMALRRDGRIDRSFGHNGRVNLPVIGEGQTIIEDVAVDPEGRILVLAAARFAKGGGLTIVARLSANGALDSSFADNGILVTDFGLPAPQPTGPSATPGAPTDVLPADLAIDSQGRLVVAGTTIAAIAPCRDAGEQPHHAAYIARLLPGGGLDTSFGDGGVVLDERNSFYVEQHPSMGGLALHEGQIFYATEQNDAANCEGFGGGLLVHLNQAGERVRGFGSAGVTEVTPLESRPRGIAIDRQGRILVMRNEGRDETPYNYEGGFDVISRWNADGTLDLSFGHRGEVAVELPGDFENRFEAIATDAHDRPVLVGRIARPRGSRQTTAPVKFALMRLRASGRPDPGFGRKGQVTIGFGSGSKAVAADIALSGGKAIAAGPVLSQRLGPGQGFAVTRFRLER